MPSLESTKHHYCNYEFSCFERQFHTAFFFLFFFSSFSHIKNISSSARTVACLFVALDSYFFSFVSMFRNSFFSRVTVPVGQNLYAKYFSVSPRVWKRISEVNQREGYLNRKRILRLAIESGGCHGYLYKFSFDAAECVDSEDDIRICPSPHSCNESCASSFFSSSSLEKMDDRPQLVVDKHTLRKLQNATIDFHSELKGSAFVVVGNELVDQSCACAMSFSVRKKKSSDKEFQKPKDVKGTSNSSVSRGTEIKR